MITRGKLVFAQKDKVCLTVLLKSRNNNLNLDNIKSPGQI